MSPTPDQPAIDALVAKITKKDKPERVTENGGVATSATAPLDVEKAIEVLNRDPKRRALFDGSDEGHPSPSEADGAFFHHVAYYGKKDPRVMEEIALNSGRNRPKWHEKRGSSTWLRWELQKAAERVDGVWGEGRLQPQDEVRSRSRSLGSTGMRNEEDRDLKQSIQALSFCGREKPGPREWIVDNHVWVGHATSWFGEGGVAKSMLALHLGLAVAAKEKASWMGFTVKTAPVLYLDFELDEDEQHRRAYQLATGMGLSDIPENFYYLSVAMVPPKKAFKIAAEECCRLDVELVIVDSVGFALDGDSENARDVLGFYRENIQPLKDAGASPLLIDHQAKIVKGEKYADKQAFGSVYKTNAVRSSFQIRGSSDQGEITATFTHKKNNFGWKERDFSVRVVFGGEKTTVELLDNAVPNPDCEPSKKEQVLEAIEAVGRTTAEKVAASTEIGLKTVRNAITELLSEGALKDTGEKEGRSRIVIPHSLTTKGTGTGTNLDKELSLGDGEVEAHG